MNIIIDLIRAKYDIYDQDEHEQIDSAIELQITRMKTILEYNESNEYYNQDSPRNSSDLGDDESNEDYQDSPRNSF